MATLSHSESRRLYSWWWDSHISPKNSKWLQENLTDMDGKVRSMIKLIEEDADSFARRAEMYYKKRPELMKLVEEFYRAYRALAERYNHTAGELHHAQCTLTMEFSDQVPFELAEDSPSNKLDQNKKPHTPEINLSMRALFNTDYLPEDDQGVSATDIHAMNKRVTHGGSVGKDIKQENEREEDLRDKILQLSNENQNLTNKVLHETQKAGNAENEIHDLKTVLMNAQAEKNLVFMQYHKCLKKLSEVEEELNNAQNDSVTLDEKSSMAEIEIQTLKESIVQAEKEKIAALVKHKEYMENISNLEALLLLAQEDRNGLQERAIRAESEVQSLKDDIARSHLENNIILDQYKQSLAKISDLESIISNLETDAKLLKMKTKGADGEILELKNTIAQLNKDKETSALQYNLCLETIKRLEEKLSMAAVNLTCLAIEVMDRTEKLRTAEENHKLVDMSNQSLRVEADGLAKKIEVKDQELSKKQQDLEKLQARLQDERLRYFQIEATSQNLHNLNSQSEDERKALELDLKNEIQKLTDLEVCKSDLELENHQVRNDDCNLTRTNLSSSVIFENMQNEINSLRKTKLRLEKNVLVQMGMSESLQQQISSLKEQINEINSSYEALEEQFKAAGLNPKCAGASLKKLVDENFRLKNMCDNDENEKAVLSKKLENIEAILTGKSLSESFLLDLKGELEASRKNVKALDDTYHSLRGENATLIAEKASLFSQLHVVTENMQKLLQKNAVLENSLFVAKIELEGLKEKSKGLEEICSLLKNERSNLLTESGSLVIKLEIVERKQESLEKKLIVLEGENALLEKEKETMNSKVDELKITLGDQNEERLSSQLQTETRFAGLETRILLLQQENELKKNKYDEELEMALKSQFEISVLKKFMKEMEEKNHSLLTDCQKHVEASKMAEKVISELESESLEQQVETELLLDEIERLRLDIYQVFRAVETSPDPVSDRNIEDDKALVRHILEIIENMKVSISENEDDKQQLWVENLVLVTVLQQLESKSIEIESQKIYFEHEFKTIAKNFSMVKKEKEIILEMNRLLKSDVIEGNQHAAKLDADLKSICLKQINLQKSCTTLQGAYAQVNMENKSFSKRFSYLKDEKFHAHDLNDSSLLEFLAIANNSAILCDLAKEKMMEYKFILEDLNRKHEVTRSLELELSTLRRQLELQKAESFLLTDAVSKLELEMQQNREYSIQMKKEIVGLKESLTQTEAKLVDTELKLEATENLNSSLNAITEKLKAEIQESMNFRGDQEKSIFQSSEKNNAIEQESMESLHSVNSNLESELCLFRNEIEEKIIIEQKLRSDLQDKNAELKLWESEAEAFYFDLQVSSVHEVMFQDKIQELTWVCKDLENERSSEMLENEQMKGRIFSMENEIGGLKSKLNAYAPIIASLKDDIAFLEHHTLLLTKLKAAQNEFGFVEAAGNPVRSIFKKILEDQSFLDLQKLQARVKAVRKIMEETNKPDLQVRSNLGLLMNEMELQSHRSFGRDKNVLSRKKRTSFRGTPKLQRIKNKATKLWNGMLMKDTTLDQVSSISSHVFTRRGNVGADDQLFELCETSKLVRRDQSLGGTPKTSCRMIEGSIVKMDTPSTDSDIEKEFAAISARRPNLNPEMGNKKIHERLASDVKKLEILQTVENLSTKMEINQDSRKSKNIDFETVHEQLLEAETVEHLWDTNVRLAKNIEVCPCHDVILSPNEAKKLQRMKTKEQACKGSERIDRLQLELQKIQCILMKLEDDNKKTGKSKFFKSKTIILRNLMYNVRKNSAKRKESRFCGCLKPSTILNARSL